MLLVKAKLTGLNSPQYLPRKGTETITLYLEIQNIPMPNKETDPIRENRIDYEIVVDAYDESERAMGWYYYLQDKITFPFLAIWKKTNKKTGAIATKEIEVIGMASEEDCESNMYVEVAYIDEKDDTFTAKLSDIEAINPDPNTTEALADWQYWLDMNYEF